MKKLGRRGLLLLGIATSISMISAGAFTLSWFLGPNIDASDQYLYGQIGLRNYFFSGDGTESKPYEIVSPIHFYNLTRLQNLGIFPAKTHFQIGHLFDIEGNMELRCINRYDENNNPIYDAYLDMQEFCQTNTLITIGGEGVPFVSEIDGKGLPIRNLTICGNPEDVGVFGYVAHNGLLKNLVFDNLTVTSLGYNNTVGRDDNQLFSEDIDDIFSEASSDLTKNMTLTFYDHNATTEDYDSVDLKKRNGASGTSRADINSSSNVVSGTYIFDGYFKPTFPGSSINPRFTYSMISSSPIIRQVGDLSLDGSSPTDFTLDFEPLYNSVDFNKANEYQVNAKIYLVASVKVDGHIFSRVIQSYSIEVYSNSSVYLDGKYSCSIFCDYLDQGSETDHVTGYHHGVNVGLLAGHVDGSLKDCYVYNGQLKFNDTNYHPVMAESDTALVGEIGKNVKNTIDPDIGLVVNGDIGVMNFSRIYSLIRSDMTYPKTIKAGRKTSTGSNPTLYNYVSYKEFINEDNIDLFKDVLRYYTDQKDNYEFITKTNTTTITKMWDDLELSPTIPNDYNTVDFLWNRVVEDEDGIDRGLGVFKIVSAYSQLAKDNPDEYGPYMVNNIGDSRILNSSKPYTKVYFSTAEYDHTKDNEGLTWNSEDDIPKRATDLPSYSDVMSFDYQFARDFNYVFELDLSRIDDLNGNDYMYNNDSNFLTNYLSSKLIDKYGDPVEPGSPRFGFMFRSSENDMLSSLSSYMPVGKPGAKQPFESEGTTKYYPSSSIVFHIDNPNGANVSVVGNNDDITIYSFDPNTSSGGTTALYTMKSKNLKDSTAASTTPDTGRYFICDPDGTTTRTTETQAHSETGNMDNLSDVGLLYGHIFKLPKGDYVIGANSGTANIFFLAVQGQTEGTIGSKETITLDDAIDDVDFLLTKPAYDDFASNLDKALFSYKAYFNTAIGVVTHGVTEVGGKKYMSVSFNNNPIFVTLMHLKSRKAEHVFYFNGQMYDVDVLDYTP